MTFINIFAALVICYRVKKRLLTLQEVVLLALWFVHGALVEAQLFTELKGFKIDWRYLDPANAILWLEAAWGLAKLWSFARGRFVIAVVLVGFALTNGAMVVKHLFPVGRRARVVAVCREGARQIQADWKGPVRDEQAKYSSGEYHPVERPVVEGPKSFKSAQRLLGVLAGGRSSKLCDFPETDKPDYWLLDEAEHPPADSAVLRILSCGKHCYVLYGRLRK